MKNLVHIFFMICILLFSGCTSFIEIDPPKNQVVSKSVFISNETAIAALTGIYAQISRDGFGSTISLTSGLAGDELKNYSTNSVPTQFYQNVPLARDAYSNTIWTQAYSYIYQANTVLEGCAASSALSGPVKKQLMAEAHFIRAFSYFYLVNLYGEVPLLTTTNYEKNAVSPRVPVSEVYQQITTDLQYAADNLPENYVDAASTGESTERIRANRFTALALLARVYLYDRSWELAINTAKILIDQTATYDTVSLNSAFLNNNKEAIWQLQMVTPPPTSNQSTWEATNYVLITRPNNAGTTKTNTISHNLQISFENGDKRFSNWIGTYTDVTVNPNISYYFPNKYKINTSAVPTERSTVLRLAEQYLIRAEASAQLNDLDQANKDTNIVRKRAGLAPLAITDKESMLTAILRERQVELFTEWGHRWFDLKRSGKIDAVMSNVLPDKGGMWKSSMALWPIPQSDIDNNPNLKQNSDYQ